LTRQDAVLGQFSTAFGSLVAHIGYRRGLQDVAVLSLVNIAELFGNLSVINTESDAAKEWRGPAVFYHFMTH
jgi:hypothetical protein